ncbi:MAG TPA: S9 family peptidase, partial [Dehalococcoidia bacterium]|nr:S9 family peptidase [Dehalococcoidia bacterium]
DLEYAQKWLVSSGWAAEDRIAVMGGSYGGFMTLSAITTYPDLWKAAVELFGIGDFLTFLENTGSYRRRQRSFEYGDPVEDAEFLREISPIHRADAIKCPLMALHGARDPRVPISETEKLVATLSELGQTVEYVRFEDEGHGFVKRPNRITAYTAIADFLDANL